jgi:hypothetical protein
MLTLHKGKGLLLVALLGAAALLLIVWKVQTRQAGVAERPAPAAGVPEAAQAVASQPAESTNAAAVATPIPATLETKTDLQALSSAALKQEIATARAALVRARVDVLNNSEDLSAKSVTVAEKQRALDSRIQAHPDAVRAEEARLAAVAEFKALSERMQNLGVHMEQHGQPSPVLAEGRPTGATTPPQPREGCEFCQKDFDKLVAGDAALLEQYSQDLDALVERQSELGRAVRQAERACKATDARLKTEDPDLRALAAEADGLKQALAAAVDAAPEVSALQAQIGQLTTEWGERRRAVIAEDVAAHQRLAAAEAPDASEGTNALRK